MTMGVIHRLPLPPMTPRMADLARQRTSAISEADLLSGRIGLGPIVPRAEDCACGGIIRVEDAGDHWLVARAVNVHNASTEHEQWAIAAGLR